VLQFNGLEKTYGVGEGVGAAVGAADLNDVKRREKNFSARTALAASEGWKASQNTNSWRFLQTFEFGKHKPPILVSTLQHDVFETLKPAKSLIKNICHVQPEKRSHMISF